jgi:hypothetical protein
MIRIKIDDAYMLVPYIVNYCSDIWDRNVCIILFGPKFPTPICPSLMSANNSQIFEYPIRPCRVRKVIYDLTITFPKIRIRFAEVRYDDLGS